MRPIYCDLCGELTAKLEKGSSIHPKAIMICGNCNKPETTKQNPFNDLKSAKDMFSDIFSGFEQKF